jgi:hypothetical protein
MRLRAGKTNTRIQLFNSGSTLWNIDRVREFFYMENAECILNMKLPSQPSDDFPAWHYERNGIFSVKSAYKLAYNLCYGVRWSDGNINARDSERNIWKSV